MSKGTNEYGLLKKIDYKHSYSIKPNQLDGKDFNKNHGINDLLSNSLFNLFFISFNSSGIHI